MSSTSKEIHVLLREGDKIEKGDEMLSHTDMKWHRLDSHFGTTIAEGDNPHRRLIYEPKFAIQVRCIRANGSMREYTVNLEDASNHIAKLEREIVGYELVFDDIKELAKYDED
ncbi:MAG: hypothetical protein CMI54_06230 [Parcubacteria group bacterium]|jgi:hypothetical protein|nr:hypothetical protein [Parcubacteria group bacterium]|tara:strand:- start:19745 stop:20083 length:339 start_codon:yes stop_codon:yes gene_type:complete